AKVEGGQPHGLEAIEVGVRIDDRRRVRGAIIFNTGKVCAASTGNIYDLHTDVIQLDDRFGAEAESDFFDDDRYVESGYDVFDQAQPGGARPRSFGHDSFLDGVDVELQTVGGQELYGGFGVRQGPSGT